MGYSVNTLKLWRIGGLFVVFAAVTSVLVWLASTVQAGRLLPFDEPVMVWLHARVSAPLTAMMLTVTQLGGGVGVTILCAALIWLLVRRRHVAQGWFVALAVGGAGLLNVILKLLFERTRPDFWEHLVQETSYSFPSGHAMGSSALVIACAFLAWRTRWRWWTIWGGALFAVLVGVSRMYIGVHYPSDILAGWLVSFVWVALIHGVLYRYIQHKQQGTTGGKHSITSRN